jgi:Tat protein secretion system quality control protein TatD with DNase activity
MIVHTARKIAELRGIDVAELAERSTENAARRFKIELGPAAP